MFKATFRILMRNDMKQISALVGVTGLELVVPALYIEYGDKILLLIYNTRAILFCTHIHIS